MKRISTRIAILLALAAAPYAPLAAQTRPAPKPDASPVRRDLRLRVLAVLYSIADGAKDWDDRSAAARVQAQVADLTWEVNADIARGYLVRGWETASAIKEEQTEHSPYVNESPLADVKRDVMLLGRKRAPDLAEGWLAEMTAEAEAKSKERKRGVFDDRTERSAVLLRMADETVERDPKAAAELAVASLQDGVSFGLQHVLTRLQEKDFNLTRGVFRAAMSRLRIGGMSDPGELLILSSYLYTPGVVLGPNTTGERGGFSLSVSRTQSGGSTAAERDPALAVEFLRLAATLLLESPPPSTASNPAAVARTQVSVIEMLAGKISVAVPEASALLKARLSQIEADAVFSAPSSPPPGLGAPDGISDMVEQRIAALEESAEREPRPLNRDILYARGALAVPYGRQERAEGLAKKIGDEALRARVLDIIAYGAAVRFTRDGDFDKGYEAAVKIGDPAQRAAALVVGAQRLSKQKIGALTARWLQLAARWRQEAGESVRKAEPNDSKASVMLGLAAAYAKVDRATALEFLESAVKLTEKLRVLPLEERAPLGGKISGLNFDDFTFETSGFGLGSAIEAFGWSDFEALLQIFERIREPSVRGTAVVLLCRKHLVAAPGDRKRGADAGARPSTSATTGGAEPAPQN